MINSTERARQKRDEARARAQNDRLRRLVTPVALTVAMAGAVGALLSIRNDESQRNAQFRAGESVVRVAEEQREIVELTRRLNDSEQTSARIQRQLLDAMSHPTKAGQKMELTAADRRALEDTEKSNAGLDQRLTALETALLQTPEKAVALPLLRQQLNDIQDKAKGDSDSLHSEINHLYGMMQWFLGLMITLIIGVGGLAANSFRQGGERQRPHTPERGGEPASQPGTSVTSHFTSQP